MKPIVLQLRGLTVTFAGRGQPVYAVRGVSLELRQAETLGLVGESGSGKSALGAALMNLHDSDQAQVAAESWRLGQTPLTSHMEGPWREVRGRRIAMVFQDPMTALNPYRRIGSQLHEVLLTHTKLKGPARHALCLSTLLDVGLPHGEGIMQAYPHTLSGGMRQRVVLAMALLGQPELLIADEPTTALDVTVQAQILALLKGLCEIRGMAMLCITHDLAVLAGIAQRIAVMYAGEWVEVGPTQALYDSPMHPYSRALWRAMPDLTAPKGMRPQPIAGAPPNLAVLPRGCAFAPRCPQALPICRDVNPEPRALAPLTLVRCHNPCGPKTPAEVAH